MRRIRTWGFLVGVFAALGVAFAVLPACSGGSREAGGSSSVFEQGEELLA